MNETEDICVMKTINDFYEKLVKNPPLDQPARPVNILAVQDGLVGGALG